jgi:hypothetical protein
VWSEAASPASAAYHHVMDLRRAFFERSMKLLRHPKIERALADPRAMDVFVAAVRLQERARRTLAKLRRRLAR